MKTAKSIFLLILATLFLSGCIAGGGRDGGVFKSDNGGNTFSQKVRVDEKKNIGGVDVLSIAVNPVESSEVYIGTKNHGMFKSVDYGDTWQPVKILKRAPTKVYSINIDPFNSKTVYAVAVIDKRGKILKTEDGGESWKDVYTEPASGTSVLSLALDPVDSKKVYAGTSDGQIIFSENGGDSWKSLYWANNGVYKIAVSKFNPQVVLFAVFQGSILRTNDGGRSFEDLGKREIEASEGERYRNSEFLRNPTAITFDPYRTDWVYVGSSAGLVRSKNAGDSWELVQILNKPQEQAIRGVKINPQNSDEIIYGASQTFYKSIDGGTNWKTIQFNTNRTLETVVYDPKNPSVIYVGMNKR